MAAGDYLPKHSLESRQTAEAIDAGRTCWGGTSTHSSNDFTINLTVPAHRALTGEIFRWIPDASNTGATTLTVKDIRGNTALASTAVKRADGGTALLAGDIVSGIPVETLYDGSVHRLLARLSGAAPIANTYTPTLTNIANLDSVTAFVSFYVRVADIVIVWGILNADPTTGASTVTRVGISLPIASNLASTTDCEGLAFSNNVAGQGAGIFGDVANDRAEMRWLAVDTTDQPMRYSFAYRVL